jgi:hypothetical protein
MTAPYGQELLSLAFTYVAKDAETGATYGMISGVARASRTGRFQCERRT